MEALTLIFNTSTATEVCITIGGGRDIVIDWDDGIIQPLDDVTGKVDHTYKSTGLFTVKVTGSADWLSLKGNESLIECTSFGNLGLTTFEGMFSNCTGLIRVPNEIPNTVTSTSSMFSFAESFNCDIASWNTSKVIDMSSMFSSATSFNQKIGSWDTSKVTNMSSMLCDAVSFNQCIGGWDTDKLDDMSYMFSYTKSFNRDITSWNTSNVTLDY